VMRRSRAAMLLLPMLLVAGGSVMLAVRGEPKAAVAKADCAARDQAASLRIATLVSDDSAAAELRLDEALAQLRRARKYCRSGLVTVAERDYLALERAIPGDVTASIGKPDR
jgi:hypothetical protein